MSSAGGQEISFLANPRYQSQLGATKAAAVIVSPMWPRPWKAASKAVRPLRWSSASIPTCCMPAWPSGSTRRVVPRYRAARILPRWWRLTPSSKRASASARSVSWNRARASDAAPCWARCVIGAGSSVGPDSLLHAHVTLYEGVKVGARAILHSGVVLGADGFGFAPDPSLGQGAWGKIPSWAAWPSATTSRSAPTPRSIAARSKTPSWRRRQAGQPDHGGSQLPHRRTHSDGRVRGVAGSTTIGERCTIGGAAMLSGHLTLGDDVHISGGTAVTSNILKPGRYTGLPVRRARRMAAQRRRDTTVGAVAPPRALARKRRGSAARRTPQDHFISQEFTEKWNSTSRGSWSVCRIVTRCC